MKPYAMMAAPHPEGSAERARWVAKAAAECERLGGSDCGAKLEKAVQKMGDNRRQPK